MYRYIRWTMHILHFARRKMARTQGFFLARQSPSTVPQVICSYRVSHAEAAVHGSEKAGVL